MIFKIIKLLFKLKCKLTLLKKDTDINDLIYYRHCINFDLQDIIYDLEQSELIKEL